MLQVAACMSVVRTPGAIAGIGMQVGAAEEGLKLIAEVHLHPRLPSITHAPHRPGSAAYTRPTYYEQAKPHTLYTYARQCLCKATQQQSRLTTRRTHAGVEY